MRIFILALLLSIPLSAQALQNGAGGTFTYYGDDPSMRARLACESRYGVNNCTTHSCGYYSYWHRYNDQPSCSCSFPVGEFEWVYANGDKEANGYSGVGEDFGQGALPSVIGATEFVRQRTSDTCGADAWALTQAGYPLDDAPLESGASTSFTSPTNATASTRAKAACESKYGVGACSLGECGCFSYWYPRAVGSSCSCSVPAGTYEWVFANRCYSGVGEDFGQGTTPRVAGLQSFVRRKNTNACYANAWSIAQREYPSTLIQRENANADRSTISWASEFTADPVHAKQMFLNNLDRLGSVSVLLSNWGASTTDFVTLKIGTACGGGTGWQYWGGAVVALPAGKDKTWATISLPSGLVMQHGAYYILEVSTQHAQLAVNRDRYSDGRRVKATDALDPRHFVHGELTSFHDSSVSSTVAAAGQRKQDLIFVLRGSANPASALHPTPTTNRACPASCILVNNTENSPKGSPANAINVLLREVKGLPDGKFSGGSFYTDDMAQLRSAVWANTLTTSASEVGLDQTPPYAGVFPTEMNFYIAREDPSWDPEYLRGFMHCANIDMVVDVNTGEWGGAVSGMGFDGTIPDPRLFSWGAWSLQHEVMGHGFGLTDEYVCWSDGCALSTAPPEASWPNSVPLGSGTTACADPAYSGWCSSSIPVDQLITKMANAADPNQACWSYGASECPAHADRCYDISALGISYFGAHRCVPKTVVQHDIGVGCVAGSGCFIGAAIGPDKVSLYSAQPGAAVMGGTNHSHGQLLGASPYGAAMTSHLAKMLSCVFDTTGCMYYDDAMCSAFLDKWDGGGSPTAGNAPYLYGARACEGGVSRRR